jgi:ATPase family associated with various cellular activities (AAA)
MAKKTTRFQRNIVLLEAEIAWLRRVMQFRFEELTGQDMQDYKSMQDIPVPVVDDPETPYGEFVSKNGLAEADRLLLILAVTPYLKPGALDGFLATYPDKTSITEFGGHRGQVHRGFLPTVESALFLLAGTDLTLRVTHQNICSQYQPLFRENWLRVEQANPLEPYTCGILMPTRELLDFLTTGVVGEPEFGASFPAEKIVTKRTWKDLILPTETLSDIEDIKAWIKHEHQVMHNWKLSGKLSPGFRCLFHGPPGTGKTFTATLLGQATGRDVYRIDLSMVVSKYIGETEKNLKIVFDKAQSRGWILFFDEADALFGKRTDVSDSKDRYANQEVSYLLQRVEHFDGVVILATNNRENMDKAFTRRFQVVVHFPLPTSEERLHLWKTSLPGACKLAPGLSLSAIADRYELTGGSIMNVVRHCALRAAMRGKPEIQEFDMIDGIRREYRKAGRILS